MKRIEEVERVFGYRTPKTLWVLGSDTKEILEKTHMERTSIHENKDGVCVYIDVTSQYNKPQDFFIDLKRSGNFMVKIPVRITEKIKLISTGSRFFIFHRKYLNMMSDEEIPRIILVNNKALKQAFIFRELIAESLQFVSDTESDLFNETVRKSNFEEVEIIKKKYTQTIFT